MQDDITLDIDPIKQYGKNMQAFIKQRLKGIINGTMIDLQKDLRKNKFVMYDGGKHDDVLMRRSGHLSNSIRVEPAVMQGTEAVGGLSFGKKYAGVLIGKRGKVITIVPTNKQFLAIPLPGALDAHGVPKGIPEDKSVFPYTFIHKGTIFGHLGYVKGARKGEIKSDLLPLFLLRRSVDVKVRIASEDLLDFTKKNVEAELQKLKADLK